MLTNLLFKYTFIIINFLVLSTPFAANAAASTDKPVIIVLGDSISAGYGIDIKQGWVNLLQHKLDRAQYRYQVINASVSGDTSSGGLARLPFILKQHQPSIVILELGGNDGLRGIPTASIRSNFSAMIDLCHQYNSQVLMLGMLIPPNYGTQYTQAFKQIYLELAAQKQISLLPFLLEGVASNPELMQSDGIHPTQAAQSILLESVWRALQPLLTKTK